MKNNLNIENNKNVLNPKFQAKNLKKSPSELLHEDAVKVLYDYACYNLNSEQFDQKFQNIIDEIENNKINAQGWLKSMIYEYKLLDGHENATEYNFVPLALFMNDIDQTLRSLKNKNKYTNIIKTDKYHKI